MEWAGGSIGVNDILIRQNGKAGKRRRPAGGVPLSSDVGEPSLDDCSNDPRLPVDAPDPLVEAFDDEKIAGGVNLKFCRECELGLSALAAVPGKPGDSSPGNGLDVPRLY